MAAQGSMICARNCLLIMAKWSDPQPACPCTLLFSSPSFSLGTSQGLERITGRFSKQRLLVTCKGKKGWTWLSGNFFICPVSLLSQPLPAWRILNGTLHTLGSLSLCWGNIKAALWAASRVTAHAEEIICTSSFALETAAWFSRAVTQMKTYRGPVSRGALGDNVPLGGELNED